MFRRCDRLVKRLKGTDRRSRPQAEGHDDVNTFSVLAAEGFLPGYGLEVGSVVGWAEIPFWRTGAMDFSLPRPPATALREYGRFGRRRREGSGGPGNLIYANGHRFVARRFHRDLHGSPGRGSQASGGDPAEMPFYEVSVQRQAVRETRRGEASSLSGTVLQTMAVCDADLIHTSHISDEEDLRFQLGVAVYGTELGQHGGGRAFRWGPQPVHLRQGVRLRLVNVGAASIVGNSSQGSSASAERSRRHVEGYQRHAVHVAGIGRGRDQPQSRTPRPCWRRHPPEPGTILAHARADVREAQVAREGCVRPGLVQAVPAAPNGIVAERRTTTVKTMSSPSAGSTPAQPSTAIADPASLTRPLTAPRRDSDQPQHRSRLRVLVSRGQLRPPQPAPPPASVRAKASRAKHRLPAGRLQSRRR